jgi:hypothetical protein
MGGPKMAMSERAGTGPETKNIRQTAARDRSSRVPTWLVSLVVEGDVEERTDARACLSEQEIEEWVQGRLPAEAEEFCLAHVVGCRVCGEKVEAERDFARATREAVLQMRKEPAATMRAAASGLESRAWLQALSAWAIRRGAIVSAVACLLVAVVLILPRWRSEAERIDVTLRSERGNPGLALSAPTAGSRLRLRIDVSDVAPAASYGVSLVDATGQVAERSTVSPASGTLVVPVRRSLAPGQYWVRLAAPDGAPLREYALRIR